MSMKRAFTRKDFIITIVILVVFCAITLPKVLGLTSGSPERQDMVHARSAQKLAVLKFKEVEQHDGEVLYYYDASRVKVLDAANRRDAAKLSSIRPYGSSTRMDYDGSRTGAVGVPDGKFLKIQMDSTGKILGMFWVKEAEVGEANENAPAED